tara:strand:- start:395 stop:1138 length:744 start_codon:yes stop_codon:yes gene_type:complete
MKTNEIIYRTIKSLLNESYLVSTKKWQAVSVPYKMYELNNVFLEMEICKEIKELEKETNADIPWSEDHFIERISGATNPGKQYKNWPYYIEKKDDSRFRYNGKFSHTYQERFWPPSKDGIRFKMGDYNDVKNRLKKDKTTRQCFLSIWHPEDQSNNDQRLPCTIGYWFKINNNKLDVTYLIRSCDAVRHFRNDIYMTQRLAMDVYSFLNNKQLSLGKMFMWIGSFHCFESDIYYLKKQIKTTKNKTI